MNLPSLPSGISTGFWIALGVLAGYEVQASEVADTKGAGLSEHYGVSGEGLEFWHIHAELEKDHAAWVLEAAEAAESESRERPGRELVRLFLPCSFFSFRN